MFENFRNNSKNLKQRKNTLLIKQKKKKKKEKKSEVQAIVFFMTSNIKSKTFLYYFTIYLHLISSYYTVDLYLFHKQFL